MLSLGRLPPVDGGGGVFHAIAPELPEGFAHAGFAAAVHAEPDAGSQPFGVDQQRRESGGKRFRFFARAMRHALLNGSVTLGF